MSSVTQLHEPSSGSVPYAVRDPLRIPRERYFDRKFYDLEKEKLWFRTWQMGCRLQEIPRPHDYVEYEICGESILIIRQRDGSARAFFNACRHRGTQLAQGAGRFGGGLIVCPYHGWRYKTDGSCALVHGQSDFAPECLRADDIKLRECKAAIWGGCVWINPDLNAGPLMDALQPVAAMFDQLDIENQRVIWWKEVILNANWKVAQEAFMESLHVMQTHPQLTMGAGDSFVDTADYRVYPNGHSGFANPDIVSELPSLDVVVELNRLLCEEMDGLVLARDVQLLEGLRDRLRPGDNSRASVAQAFRDSYLAAGIAMGEGVETQLWWWSANVFLFPNFFMLPMYGNVMSYRSRPYNDDPQWCRFEMWSLTAFPRSDPMTRAKLTGRFDKADKDHWSRVPLQDFSNIERQQRGIHSRSYESHRLARKWEGNISHMHRELDRRLARP